MPKPEPSFSQTSRPWLSARIFFKWDKSFYRLIVWDFGLFIAFYIALSVGYHFAFNYEQREIMENFGDALLRYKLSAAMEFVIGLFIGRVVNRYLAAYRALPWPDGIALYSQSYIIDPQPVDVEDCPKNKPAPTEHRSSDQVTAKHFRCAIYRYICCGMILAISRFSSRVRRRFPNARAIMEKHKLLTQKEVATIKTIKLDVDMQMSAAYSAHPFTWCMCLIKKARKQGLISSDSEATTLKEEVTKIANLLSTVLDTYMMPQITFTALQVILIVVYMYLALIAFRLSTLADLFDFTNRPSVDEPASVKLAAELSRFSPTHDNASTMSSSDLATLIACKIVITVVLMLQIALYLGIIRTSCSLIWTYNGNGSYVDVGSIIDRNLQYLDYCLHDQRMPECDIFDEQFCASYDEKTLQQLARQVNQATMSDGSWDHPSDTSVDLSETF